MTETASAPTSSPDIEARAQALLPELIALVVTAVNLDTPPSEVSPDEALYADGLGLDSIDILEIALVVSKQYGFQLRSDDSNNQTIFTSMRHLARHVVQHRTK